MKKAILTLVLLSMLKTNAQCWEQIAPSSNVFLGLKTDGTIWACGHNSFGEVGDGTNINRDRPTQVGTSNDWDQVFSSINNSLAIKNDGTLWAWGYNSNGELGVGSTIFSSNVPLQIPGTWIKVANGGAMAMKSDGTLWAWGNGVHAPVQINTDTNWSEIAMSGLAFFAIKNDGTLWSWGTNTYGQLGLGTTTDVAVPTQIGSSNNWVKIVSGNHHLLALKSDGTLWAWGFNLFGQLGIGVLNSDRNVPTRVGTDNDWISIGAGNYHSLAIKSDHSLWAWGLNQYRALADGTNTPRTSPQRVGTSNNWAAADGGQYYSAGLTLDGSLMTWGGNTFGEVGIPGATILNVPTLVDCTNLSNEEFNNANIAVLFPNPTKEIINIKTFNKGPKTIELYDLQGRMILSGATTEADYAMNVFFLPSGSYVVKVLSETSSQSYIVIKS